MFLNENMKKIILEDTDYILHVCSKIESLKDQWYYDTAATSMLDWHYLKAIAAAAPYNMSFLYAMVLHKDQYIGHLYFQIQPFEADKSLKIEVPKLCDHFFESVYAYSKKYLARQVKLTSLVLGNLLLTGQHGFSFKPDVDYQEQQSIVARSIHTILQHKALCKNASICITKDYSIQHRLNMMQDVDRLEMFEFQVQPGMRFFCRDSWSNIDDYLSDLNSKSRLRLRKALDSISHLRFQELSADDLLTCQGQIYPLYRAVAENVGFNVLNLDENYFYQVKLQLGDRFKVFVLREDDRIIAFYTYFVKHNELLAHFLGFEKKEKQKEKIYTNILIRLIEHGILHRVDSIDLGRTALEIKSSVGAEEEVLYCYITHRSKWYNKFLNKILDYLMPTEVWIKRNPFKESK